MKKFFSFVIVLLFSGCAKMIAFQGYVIPNKNATFVNMSFPHGPQKNMMVGRIKIVTSTNDTLQAHFNLHNKYGNVWKLQYPNNLKNKTILVSGYITARDTFIRKIKIN